MVVCVDKYTAVKMYDLVQHYWDEEKLNLIVERNNAKTQEERNMLTRAFDYMNKVKMAVVISENGDDDKFTSRGLNIQKHRDEMNRIDENGGIANGQGIDSCRN